MRAAIIVFFVRWGEDQAMKVDDTKQKILDAVDAGFESGH